MTEEVESAIFNVDPYQYEPLRIRMLQPPMTRLTATNTTRIDRVDWWAFVYTFLLWKVAVESWINTVKSLVCSTCFVLCGVYAFFRYCEVIPAVCFAFLYDVTVCCCAIKLIARASTASESNISLAMHLGAIAQWISRLHAWVRPIINNL